MFFLMVNMVLYETVVSYSNTSVYMEDIAFPSMQNLTFFGFSSPCPFPCPPSTSALLYSTPDTDK